MTKKIFPAFLLTIILLVPTVLGALGESTVTISTSDTGSTTGATVSAAPSPSPSPSPSSSSSSTGTTPGAAATTTTPAATPTTPEVSKPVSVTPVSIPVTEAKAVQEVVSVINPADLGVAQIKSENIQVTKTGVAEVVTTTQAPILQKAVDDALPVATQDAAKQVLNEIKQAVSSGSSAPISVTSTVEVFEVKEKTTNKTAFATKISLSFKADKKLQDVNIVEVIPKTVASNVTQVVFSGEQPKVLQSDPIVQWIFPVVEQGQTKHLSYQVAKKLETVDVKTIAVGAAVAVPVYPTPAPTPQAKPSLTYLYVIGGLVVLLVIAFIVYRQMKMKKV